ncbi:Non-specific lipid-transfer protein-like protein [Drosera capensis]
MASSSMLKLSVAFLMCMMVAALAAVVLQAAVAPECKLLTPMFMAFCGPAVAADVVPGRPCCVMLDMMNSRMDAQASCQCIKAAVQNITGYNWFYSSQIPKKCGAYPSFPISRGVNCSRAVSE